MCQQNFYVWQVSCKERTIARGWGQSWINRYSQHTGYIFISVLYTKVAGCLSVCMSPKISYTGPGKVLGYLKGGGGAIKNLRYDINFFKCLSYIYRLHKFFKAVKI